MEGRVAIWSEFAKNQARRHVVVDDYQQGLCDLIRKHLVNSNSKEFSNVASLSKKGVSWNVFKYYNTIMLPFVLRTTHMNILALKVLEML